MNGVVQKEKAYQSADENGLFEVLHQALGSREFTFFYQPIVDSHSGKTGHYESLARWLKNETVFGPEIFIEELKQTGLIKEFTKYAVLEAVQRISYSRHFGISVNVSPGEIDEAFVDFLADTIREKGIDPSRLIIEVTEELPLVPEVWVMLHSIGKLGIRLAMDDFGTGFTDLYFLGLFQGGFLKLDRSLLPLEGGCEEATSMVRSAIQRAHMFNMKVIAEGVESESMSDCLRRLGVDYQQGFYHGKPVLQILLD